VESKERKVINWKNQEVSLTSILETDVGWNDIIYRLYDDLVALGWDRELHQCKEKFGSLRFYIGYGNDDIFARIAKAEIESEKTCEICGKEGTITGKYWLKCTCPDHKEEQDK